MKKQRERERERDYGRERDRGRERKKERERKSISLYPFPCKRTFISPIAASRISIKK